MTTPCNDEKLIALENRIVNLENRIKNLEDIISPPGGPNFGAQLATLGRRINTTKIALRKEIKQVYEIVAELQMPVMAHQKQVDRRRRMRMEKVIRR